MCWDGANAPHRVCSLDACEKVLTVFNVQQGEDQASWDCLFVGECWDNLHTPAPECKYMCHCLHLTVWQCNVGTMPDGCLYHLQTDLQGSNWSCSRFDFVTHDKTPPAVTATAQPQDVWALSSCFQHADASSSTPNISSRGLRPQAAAAAGAAGGLICRLYMPHTRHLSGGWTVIYRAVCPAL